MAELKSSKYNNVYKLLLEHNFKMYTNIPSDLVCTKCKHILVDACQVSCGCSYCRSCIDDLLANDSESCPGNTVFCKDEQLTDIQRDHFKNKKILRLVVKCPEELCSHECELINMEEHLRLCSYKCIKCPFYGLGCDVGKLRTDKISDHLQSDGYIHNIILINIIENLRNDVNMLKEMDKTNKIEIQSNKTQIQIFQANSLMKDEIIVEITEQIRSIKMENQQMTEQIEALKEQLKSQTEQIAAQMNEKCRNDEIESIKMENRDLAQQMEILERNVDGKMQVKCAQERQGWPDDLGMDGSSICDRIENCQHIPIEALFSWQVDQISERKQKYTNIFSGKFYLKLNSYNMLLLMRNQAGSDRLLVFLRIYASENDARLQWPFQRNVTIQISNKAHPNKFKTITKYCNIPQPSNSSYNRSDSFEFSYVELARAGLMQDNYFTIQCHVE